MKEMLITSSLDLAAAETTPVALIATVLLVDTCINFILVRLTYTWAFFISYGIHK